MKFTCVACCVVGVMLVGASISFAQQDSEPWARWRGPQGNGMALNQTPVTTWSDASNVVWKTKVPGKGHSSPIVAEDRIFLTTSDEALQTQSVLCYDRKTGQPLWAKLINTGGLPKRIHLKNTHASPSIAVNGELVFALFHHHEQQVLTALNFNGDVVWEKSIGPYKGKYPFGVGASPITYRDLVIVPHENEASSKLLAINATTGEKSWTARRSHTNYSTPVVANTGGMDQLLISGQSAVTSFNPSTGKKNWALPAKWAVTCGTAVWDNDRVYVSGGYPVQQTIAVTSDGKTEVWDAPIKAYEQSMIIVDDYLYVLTDRGVISCINGSTGEVAWKTRFEGPVSASPVYANGNLFFTAESGKTMVVKADPTSFQKIAVNQLGTSAFASFAMVDNKIITRVGDNNSGQYQEWLYCIGQ